MKTTAELRLLPNGKRVLYLDGRPFFACGVQLRPDRWRHVGGYSNEDMSRMGLFRHARDLNANCVQVPVTWKDCEPEEGVFDWANLDWALDECRKYGLRLEIVWFGSNVCGAGWQAMTPTWITGDTARFGRILLGDGSPLGECYTHPMDGQKYTLCPENPALMAAEQRVVATMMDHLHESDPDYTAIAFQPENEPSIVQHNPRLNETDRCHCPRCDLLFEGFGGEAREFSRRRLAAYIGRVAGWVKASRQPMLTRINFIPAYYMMDQDVGAFRTMAPAVDLCGYDSYEVPPPWVYNISRTDFSTAGNTPHISELGGDDPHCARVILDLLAAGGCGAEIYQLCGYSDIEDNWVVNPDGSDAKPHTEEIRQTFGMLRGAMEGLAVRENGPGRVVFFNGEGYTEQTAQCEKVLHGTKLRYETDCGGIGIAFVEAGDLVLLSAGAGRFTLPGAAAIEVPPYGAVRVPFEGAGVAR